MTIVEKKVRSMRWRLEWLNFCQRFVRLLLVALVLLTFGIILAKFIRLPWEMYTTVTLVLGATIPLAILWSILTRTTVQDAAIATDGKTGLRERLSSALALGLPQVPMEAAVLADAEVHAKPLRPRRVFPMPVWRDFYYMPAPVLVMAIVGFLVPRLDLIGQKEQEKESPLATTAQKALARRLDEFQRELNKDAKIAPPIEMRELSSEMKSLLNDIQAKKMSQTDVLQRLSSMSDRLADRKGDLEKKIEGTRKAQNLRPGEMAKKLTDAVAKGNFEDAKTELGKLADKIKKGDLSDAQRKKLASDLKGLADALKDNPALSKALQQAAKGLSGNDMQNALANMELSAEQLQDLADTLKQMAELDQLSKCMNGMRANQGTCGNCGSSSCTACINYAAMMAMMGKWRSGPTDKFGSGMGGPGKGMGGRLQMQETPTKFTSTKTRSKIAPGDIIGAIRVWGPQVKGEANQKFVQAYLERSQNAEDTLTRENIPLEMRSLVGDYFDAIRPATIAKKPDTSGAAPWQPPAETATEPKK